MTIDNAVRISGWMQPAELLWLAEQAARHLLIAEIGSWKGRSTRALADNTRGRVYAVDTWCGSNDDHAMLETVRVNPEGWLLEEFKTNLQGCNNVHVVQMESCKAAGLLRDMRFDMIFIDAAHDYESVKTDILAWRPLLASGGLLCGHDYGCAAIPGVTQAVNELLPHPKLAADSIWYGE